MAALKRGSKGNDVKELQTALNRAGANPPLDVDGDFGPLTEQVVKSFQQAVGIKVDGIAGPETIAAILAVNDRKAAEEAASQVGDKRILWGVGAIMAAIVVALLV